MNTCYFCRGTVEPAIVDYMTHDQAGYLLVKELAVHRCTQCHEIYLDPQSLRVIEKARRCRAEANEQLSIPVYSAGSY